MRDNLVRKTDAELEARRQRVLKVLEGDPPEPARMERMLGWIEAEQGRRQRFTWSDTDIAFKKQ